MNRKLFELLVVEDDMADVDLIREALNATENRPFEIKLNSVEDGEEALSYLKRKNAYQNALRPDLIILDLNMPRKSGHGVLKEIKEDDDLKTIPIVILTTSSANEDVKLAYQLGANSFITKARDFTEFLNIVRTIECYWFRIANLPA